MIIFILTSKFLNRVKNLNTKLEKFFILIELSKDFCFIIIFFLNFEKNLKPFFYFWRKK